MCERLVMNLWVYSWSTQYSAFSIDCPSSLAILSDPKQTSNRVIFLLLLELQTHSRTSCILEYPHYMSILINFKATYIIDGDLFEGYKVYCFGTCASEIYLLPSHKEQNMIGHDYIDALLNQSHLLIKFTESSLNEKLNIFF